MGLLSRWRRRRSVGVPTCNRYPCEGGDFTNLAGYPPLKPKISSFGFTSLTKTYHLSMDRQLEEDRNMEISKYLSKGKIILEPTLSLSPLCPRTSKRLSMGEEVGTMQFRVQGE
jgi:hypothetical protein